MTEHTNTPDDVALDRELWLRFPDICDICGKVCTKADMAAWAPIPGTEAAADSTWNDTTTRDCNRARAEFMGECKVCNAKRWDGVRARVADDTPCCEDHFPKAGM